MPTSFIVVDDFLSPADAHGLRQAGLGLTYPAQEGAFPGRNSLERLELDGRSIRCSRTASSALPWPATSVAPRCTPIIRTGPASST
jgi:hypothetical protein